MAIPITVRGAELLKAELKRLKSVDRPAVVQAIKEAREKGDLSENAEYDAAKELQGHIEGRIAELEGKLSSLQVTIDKAFINIVKIFSSRSSFAMSFFRIFLTFQCSFLHLFDNVSYSIFFHRLIYTTN